MEPLVCCNARFTVITPGCVRIEYAENGTFSDSPSLFAEGGRIDIPCGAHVTQRLTEDGAFVETECFTLLYKGGKFSHDTLSARIHTGSVDTVWHWGDKNAENLGGTLATLDGVDGFRPLPDGILAKDGWYMLDDSGTPVLEDGWVCNGNADSITDVYLFAYGRNYKAALKSLAAASGKMEMPRKYFFGSWYSRWWRYTSEQYLAIVDEYDKNDFPLDIMVMDMEWHHHDWSWQEGDMRYAFGYGHAGENMGWTGYTWNRRVIPDPEGLIKSLHEKGVAVTLNDHPADGVRDTDETYPEFLRILHEKNYCEQVPTIKERQTQREIEGLKRPGVENYRFNAGSRDYMEAFFKSTHDKIEAQGVDFWWLDWQQDAIYGTVNGIHGLSHLRWLNRLYYLRSEKSGKRGQSFSRWGGFGDHKHPAYFSGDTVTGWDTFAFVVQMTASAGNAGCFWWSHDTGGFYDPAPVKQSEVYVRWVQFGALSAALRLHVCGDEKIDRRPWTWGEPYCSAMRKMFHLRSRLMPYIYSSAYLSRRDSVPFLRPLYIENSECEEAYKHPGTYYVGPAMIACPVVTPGSGDNMMVRTELWLPNGTWYDFFSGEKHEGGHIVCENDLFSFPLFVKAGAPVVSQPYTGRMASAVLENPQVTVWAGNEGTIGSATLFEDDGVSPISESGEGSRITDMTFENNSEGYTFTAVPSGSGYPGEPKCRSWTLTIRSAEPCTLTEAPVGAALSYSCNDRTVTVSISGMAPGESFTVFLKKNI